MKKAPLLFASLLMLQVALFAASKNAAKVTFTQPVAVGTSTLAAGTYDVSWTEDGQNSKVTFSQKKKEVATVPATVVSKKNADSQVLTATGPAGKVLQGLDFKNATLNFSPTAAGGK